MTLLLAAVSAYADPVGYPGAPVTASADVSVRVIQPLAVNAPTALPTLPVVIKGTSRDYTAAVTFTISGEAGEGIVVTTPGEDLTDGGVTLVGTWGTKPTALGSGSMFSRQNATYTFNITGLNAVAASATGNVTFKLVVRAEYNNL